MHHTKSGSRFKWNLLLSTESRNDGKAVIIAHSQFHDCSVALRAVVFIEIFFYLLKARLRSVSHLWPVRRFMTARVVLMAVDFIEIFFYLLKARLRAVSHLWPVRRFVTARVTKTAVSIRETTFYLLLVKISCKNVLPSLIIKISTSDCPQSYIFLCEGSRLG